MFAGCSLDFVGDGMLEVESSVHPQGLGIIEHLQAQSQRRANPTSPAAAGAGAAWGHREKVTAGRGTGGDIKDDSPKGAFLALKATRALSSSGSCRRED